MSEEYADGWNSRCRGLPFDYTKTTHWKNGWRDCEEAPAEERFEIE